MASALEKTGTLVEIWVAAGTYYPAGTDRSATFTIPGNARVYGGFIPGSDFASRDWKTNLTILSGDITLAGYPSGSTEDNSYHVVTFKSNNNSLYSTLDGFIIQDGNANSITTPTDPNANGGGIWVTNPASPILDHLIVQNNTALTQGGGIYMQQGSILPDNRLVIRNSQILNNQAALGGGLAANGNKFDIINSIFYENLALNRGGAIALSSEASVRLINVSLVNNTAQAAWAVYAYVSGTAYLWSSIVWNSQPAGSAFQNTLSLYCDHSLVPASSSCSGLNEFNNIDANPQFVYLPAGNQPADLRLQPYSPAINAGNWLNVPILYQTDFAGNQRIIDGEVDMGAFEVQQPNHAPTLTQTQLTLNPATPLISSQITIHDLIKRMGVNDPDGIVGGGVAIIGYDSAPGVWEYSLDDGASWQAVGPVSSQNALLLQDTPGTWLRFSLTEPFSGEVSLQLRAWDGADLRANASRVDISASGGTAPYSAETAYANVRCIGQQIFLPMVSRGK